MPNILFYIKKYGKDALLFLLLIGCLSLLIIDKLDTKEIDDVEDSLALTEKEIVKEEKVEEPKQQEIIHVDIKGAVKKPGVYAVTKETRINEVIEKSGGFASTAYKNGINLSKKVEDEMVIYIYTKNEIKKAEQANQTQKIDNICKTPDYNICECVDNKESVIVVDPNSSKKEETPETDKTSSLVNLNTASKEELTSLTGIGSSKAEAIIAYRTENGNFKAIEDIMQVSGIGESVFAKIKDHITV